MKYAIFADMHGNIEAYKAVLSELEKEKISKYFCVGDLVGYGADPTGCIEMTEALNCVSVCGNHDWAAVGLVDIEYFNPYAKEALLWTKEAISEDDKQYLKELQLVYEDDELTLVHGTLDRPEEFNYVLDMHSAYKMLELTSTPLLFIGHSHVAGIFVLDNKGPRCQVKPDIEIETGNKYLINVGSVGQPRDGDWRAAFCVYDKDKKRIEIRRAEYDIRTAQMKILDKGLPKILAYRLAEGR